MLANYARIEIIRDIADVGKAYKEVHLGQNREEFPKLKEDWIDGLGFFLYGYAFERQGTSPAYPWSACRALKRLVEDECHPASPSRRFAVKLWKEFCSIGGFDEQGKGANAQNNPLWPDQPGDVISLCQKLHSDEHNLYRYARRCLEAGRAGQAHKSLVNVRGIGPKIASFFLRDVALDDPRIDDGSIADAWLLQPVDIWVRRTLEQLLGRELAGNEVEKAAKSVIDLSRKAGVSPLLFNAGAWYFGARIAGSFPEFKEALSESGSIRSLARKYSERLKRESQALMRHVPDGGGLQWKGRSMKLAITIYQDEDGMFVAECPAIPGCVSQGCSETEAEANMKDAILECLAVRAEKGYPSTVMTRQIEVSV